MKIITGACVWYSALTVFDPEVVGRDTGNKVKEEHLKQGFSWRQGNVDFQTIDSLGISLEILLNETVQLATHAIWAVQVPFSVTSKKGVGIFPEGSGYDGLNTSYLPIPLGNYALIFEQGFMPDWDRTGYYGEDEAINGSGSSQWGRLWFNKANDVKAKILLPGADDLKLCPHCLDASLPLRLDAEPLM